MTVASKLIEDVTYGPHWTEASKKELDALDKKLSDLQAERDRYYPYFNDYLKYGGKHNVPFVKKYKDLEKEIKSLARQYQQLHKLVKT